MSGEPNLAAVAEIHGRGDVRNVRYGMDSSLWIKFYFNRVYKRDFVEIRVPGDSRTVWDRPVKDEDRKRFAKQWDEYKANQVQLGGGIPIEECPVVPEGMRDMLKAMNCKTVENIVGISDGLIQNLGMGARAMVEQVRNWYAAQTEEEKHKRFQLALEEKEKKISLLESRLAALEEKEQKPAEPAPADPAIIQPTAQVQNVLPKRRGRPPSKKEHAV